jgi:hypothetical protein
MIRKYLLPAGKPICQTFQALAMQTWADLRDSSKAGLQRGEETITDDLLLALSRRHPDEITIVQFEKKLEGENGADWEWWLGSFDGWFGMRIQAKKLDVPNLQYLGINRKVAKSNRYQADLLVEMAEMQKCFPIYCFYNYWDQGQFLHDWKCGSFSSQVELLGCTISDAYKVRGLMKTKTRLSAIDKSAWPWMCLVCCAGYAKSGSSLPYRAHGFIKNMAGNHVTIPDVISRPPAHIAEVIEGFAVSDHNSELIANESDPYLAGRIIIRESNPLKGESNETH